MGFRPVKHRRFKIIHRESVASTNDEAQLLADSGAPDRMVVWADMQTAGKGRRGGNWSSPIGNMYVSLILRPQCELSRAAQISFVAALGLGDAISQFVAPERITNKWPNDVLIDGKKVAGLLLESSSSGAGELAGSLLGAV